MTTRLTDRDCAALLCAGLVQKMIGGRWVTLAGTTDMEATRKRLDAYGEPHEVRLVARADVLAECRAERTVTAPRNPVSPVERMEIVRRVYAGERPRDLAAEYGRTVREIRRISGVGGR